MRLIDADKLIEELTIKAVSKDAHIISIANAVVNFVNNQPTAYSVDKVVEELEERKEEREKQYKRASMEDGSYMLSKCFSEGARAYCKAIEIVKHGDVSDDVCEWKYNDAEYYWESSCEHLHIFMSDGPKENEYDFCPYCGKKILCKE